MKHLWFRIVALCVGAVGFAGAALADDWRLVRTSGEVWISSPDTAVILASTGGTVPERSTVATGPFGRALLVRGNESVVVGPGSILTIAESGPLTTIIQSAGTAEFEVERQNVQHFAVETPLLAALVKGTHFTVTASRQQAEVVVDRGIVEVTALASGQIADFTAGMHAVVTAEHGVLGFIGAQPAAILYGPPREPLALPSAPDSNVVTQTAMATTSLVDELAASILGGAGGLVGVVGEGVTDTVGAVAGYVGGSAGDELGSLGSSIGDSVGDLGSSLGDVGESVGGVVGGVGNAIGDLL